MQQQQHQNNHNRNSHYQVATIGGTATAAACNCSTSGYSSQSLRSDEYLGRHYDVAVQQQVPGQSDFMTVRTSTPTQAVVAVSGGNKQSPPPPLPAVAAAAKFASSSISTISSLHSPSSTVSASYPHYDELGDHHGGGRRSSTASSTPSVVWQFFWILFSCFNLAWLFGSTKKKKQHHDFEQPAVEITRSHHVFPQINRKFLANNIKFKVVNQ